MWPLGVLCREDTRHKERQGLSSAQDTDSHDVDLGGASKRAELEEEEMAAGRSPQKQQVLG